jgi:SEC-C motif
MSTRGRKHYSKVVWPGFSAGPAPRQVAKVGRNDPCPCGSGKKYKDCHLDAGEAFLQKLARRDEKERLRELRRELKERGIPWYRRLFLRP